MAYKKSKTIENFIQKLKKDMETIECEITDLLHQENIFRTYVIPLKDTINKHAFSELVKSHYRSAFVAIRKQTGNDSSEVSLKKLLCKLLTNNSWITEDWYAYAWLEKSSLKNDDTTVQNFINGIPISEFNEHFGKTGILDSNIVSEDIRNIEKATQKIKTYVDKVIAHIDKNTSKVQKVADRDYVTALDTLEKITSKYMLLINQVGIPNLTPVIQD